jgi:hypothetical protein
MIKSIVFAFLLFINASIFGNHIIYVIHGYGSNRLWMNKIDETIKNQNFITENYGYKSVREDLDTLGKQLYFKIKLSGVDTVSFVTHSMGALVVRSMLQYSVTDLDFAVIFRIVMISPPNSGAEIADFYNNLKIFNFFLGPNLQYMKTDSDSYANRLPKPFKSEVGIIAGVHGGKKGYNWFINGENDGLLKPERTKLGIEKEFVTIKCHHDFLPLNEYVCKLVVEFLKYGSFISK